jgi:ABC-2 type transport system ATP-binding protein
VTGTAGSSVAGTRPGPAAVAWGTRGVCVSAGKAVALEGVSLCAPAGQVTAVVGGDGAGKTTLLRCLAGLLAPDRGQVRRPGPARTGYLSAGSGTYPDLTVAENLAFRAAAYGLPPAAARERAADLTARAGLTEARDRLAGELSGGMRQKLGVIAALLHQPDLLILDEPTTGVDPVSRAGLWRLIAGAAAAGAAVVLATTYLDEAGRAASVLVLDSGQGLAAGTPGEIVAALPGSIVALAGRPGEAGAARSWRRGGSWRTWVPPGAPPPAGTAVTPDLQDAVTIAALAREPEPAPRQVLPEVGGAPVAGPGEPGGESGAAPAGGATRGAEAGGALAGARPGVPGTHRAGLAGAGVPGPGQPRVPLAECVAVTRRFGRATAVREVSLRVGPGEIVGLLGANGAGKTTLIRMLLGLLPASAGTVAIFGAPPSRESRRRIGYVPQGLGLYDDLTAAENMRFSAAVFGGPAAELPPELRPSAGSSRAARGEVTAGGTVSGGTVSGGTVSGGAVSGGAVSGGAVSGGAVSGGAVSGGAVSYGAVPVGRLPLGLQRRAAFAQALAHHPDLLILDEPTSGVDPLGRARLWDTVGSAAEAGAGVLVTTHYMEEARECHRLVIMADGAVVAEGTPAQVIGDATVTVVTAPGWQAAFRRLAEAGLEVALAGTSLRIPDADPAVVRRALGVGDGPGADGDGPSGGGGLAGGDGGAGGDLLAGGDGLAGVRVGTAAATLEERFFQLVRSAQETGAQL